MSESTIFPPAKRLRLANGLEQVPPDIVKPGSPPLESGSDDGPVPAHVLERIDTKTLLLRLLQRDTSAANLTNALKDRHIRDLLKARGLKIYAADDVGYNSLPLELRDQIREYVIADLKQHRYGWPNRECCPRLSAYACVDIEWQAAIESILFESLSLKSTPEDLLNDLDFFTQCVVGNRRYYLQRVRLPCTVRNPSHWGDHISGKLIQQLFSCMKQWEKVATPDQDFHLELTSVNSDSQSQLCKLGIPGAEIQLLDIPAVSWVTDLSLSQWDLQVSAQVFLGLLSHLPQLRHMSIRASNFDGWPSQIEDVEIGYTSEAQCKPATRPGHQIFKYHMMLTKSVVIFRSLSQLVPAVESLEISLEMDDPEDGWAAYRKAIMSYSQKLSELRLWAVDRQAMLDCFAPFRAGNRDSLVAPSLSWPKLTTLHMGKVLDSDIEGDPVESMSELMLPIARAVRYMPLIQSLTFGMRYDCSTAHVSDTNTVFFKLKVFRDDNLRGSRAVLSIKHALFDPEWNVAEALLSGTAKEVWRESLLEGANAVLEFHVESKGDGLVESEDDADDDA